MKQVLLGLCLVLAVGCGKKADDKAKGGEAKAADAKPIDCAVVGEKLKSCADDFWKAYEGTEAAKANVSPGKTVADHVKEARGMFDAMGYDKLCANKKSDFDGNPKWAPQVNACLAKSGGEACGCLGYTLMHKAK